MRHSSGQIRQVAGCVSPELGKEVGLVIKIWELSECKFMPRLWVGCLHENQAERGERTEQVDGGSGSVEGTEEQPARGVRSCRAKFSLPEGRSREHMPRGFRTHGDRTCPCSFSLTLSFRPKGGQDSGKLYLVPSNSPTTNFKISLHLECRK